MYDLSEYTYNNTFQQRLETSFSVYLEKCFDTNFEYIKLSRIESSIYIFFYKPFDTIIKIRHSCSALFRRTRNGHIWRSYCVY